MAQSERSDDGSVRRVSDAIEKKRNEGTVWDRLRDGWTWVLVDANRWLVVAGLAVVAYATVILVGVFGPVTQNEFLLGGVSGGKPYVELQTGTITVITIVLAINQLVLTPELGPVNRQRQRLEEVMSHRIEVEDLAGVTTTPTEPSQFLSTVARSTREQASRLRAVMTEADSGELRREVDDVVDDITEESVRIGETLSNERFGDIEMLGAAMHYDTSQDLSRIRHLQREYADSLSAKQRKAFDDVIDSLKVFTISREFFRTLYVRSQFIEFSRAILYTAVPALVFAHVTILIVGPNALPEYTFGVRNLLWLVAGTFTAIVLPVFVLVSYIARLVTIAKTSIFISPFMPGKQTERHSETGRDR